MIGKTISHYQILEKVGAGGMGVVYRARDEQLEREVALKVLPPGTLGDDTARRHFRQEATALAKLNHPNIETVYEFDTQDGLDFLVMEYVPGKTLANRLVSGPLPEKEVVSLGMQIAAALEEAHERGIVHRDLKPANIAVTAKGQAKVLDFGLAKLLRPVNEETTDVLSDTRAAAGTLPYMSPEQLRGEPADTRTDIFAIGAVLYEMATSRRAFGEELASRVIDAVLHHPPVSPRALNRRISPELERIILKCLDKAPDHRYQSAKELLADLRRLEALTSTGGVAPVPSPWTWRRIARMTTYCVAGVLTLAAGLTAINVGGWRDRLTGHARTLQIRSLAVLPLENLSGGAEQDYFADGMTDALITELSQIRKLRVISRTSVIMYKHTRKSLPQIARELHVDGVVEGSVMREKDHVRINAKLIRASTEQSLWANSFDRSASDVLALQSDVASAIARAVQVELSGGEATVLASSRRVAPEAYESYLKGQYEAAKRTTQGFREAIRYFQAAIAKDATYAPAYSGLADALLFLSNYQVVSPQQVIPQAKTAALKALKLDDRLAEAHASLASIRFYHLEWDGVESEFLRAIALNPGYAPAHHSYALFLAAANRGEEALTEIRLARDLDPLSLIINANIGWCRYLAGQYDQAIEEERNTLRLDPNFAVAHGYLGQVYLEKNMYEQAIEEFRWALGLSPGDLARKAELANAYARAGQREQAQAILEQLRQAAGTTYVSPYHFAVIYTGLGDKKEALAWLNRACEERNGRIANLAVHPVFAVLHGESQFEDLLRRMGLPSNSGKNRR